MVNLYKWINREKSRYYTITVESNGFNHIVLNYRWGGCNSNRGGKKNVLVKTQEEAQRFINAMMKRRKSRGYDLVAPLVNYGKVPAGISAVKEATKLEFIKASPFCLVRPAIAPL